MMSNYFPKCRKDAQCKCAMCVESLDATRDLRPPGSSCSTSSASRVFNAFCSPLPFFRGKMEKRWPLFDASPAMPKQTPLSEIGKPQALVLEPMFEQLASSNRKSRSRSRRSRGRKWFWIVVQLGLFLVLADFFVPLIMSRLFKAKLDPRMMRVFVEESRARMKIEDRLELLEYRIQRVVGERRRVSNCTGSSSKWTLAEEGAFIHSYCSLYSSMAEQVSIWGYPITTAGVLGRKPTDRFMTILAGRVIEWREGQLAYTVHKEGSTWRHARWRASAIYLDRNTWIIEYSSYSYDKPWGGLSTLAYTCKRYLHSTLLNMERTLNYFTLYSASMGMELAIPT